MMISKGPGLRFDKSFCGALHAHGSAMIHFNPHNGYGGNPPQHGDEGMTGFNPSHGWLFATAPLPTSRGPYPHFKTASRKWFKAQVF
jgi:hypothetical protein